LRVQVLGQRAGGDGVGLRMLVLKFQDLSFQSAVAKVNVDIC